MGRVILAAMQKLKGTGNTVRRGKRPAARIKTPGAFLNNATRWPVYGRTSGMRCVIARAERPGIGLSAFPIWPCCLCRLGLTAKQAVQAPFHQRTSQAVFTNNKPRQAGVCFA